MPASLCSTVALRRTGPDRNHGVRHWTIIGSAGQRRTRDFRIVSYARAPIEMEDVQSFLAPPPAAPKTSRVLLQVGAIAVVFAASPTRAFDLDRFLAPKELVLHLTALLAGLS